MEKKVIMNFVQRGNNHRYTSYYLTFHKKLGFRLKVHETRNQKS